MVKQNKTFLVDTNVILRFLVGDNKSQQNQAEQWFLEAKQNKRELVIHPLVIAEACFVLESFYKQKRKQIAQAFEVLLGQRWLKVEQREALTGLWPKYIRGLHFVDSYLLTQAQLEGVRVLTFDKKLSAKK